MARISARLPVELERLTEHPRVLVRRANTLRSDGKCVVYWMQRAMRILDNPALDVAIEAGNILALPVVVFFSVIPNYPNANLRHYHFLAQGLRDVADDAVERGVGFVVRRPPNNALTAFVAEVEAALVIGDENPCREPQRWRKVLASRLRVPFWTVDADVVVPSRVFDRTFFLMHHFRPRLKAELPKYLAPRRPVKPIYRWRPGHAPESYSLDRDITAGFSGLDRTIRPVDTFTGGTHAALRHLEAFVRSRLADYDRNRNHPEIRGTSRLSPYLHFGHIGPLTIAQCIGDALQQGQIPAAAYERFIEQFVGWRELSVLFVRHTPDYDSWECAEPWARTTLIGHAADSRPARYTFEQMERGETRDELWNAAQREMVDTGWMHNYMRMYWAKKILEWSPDPARAYQWAVALNDRYELDGRDPNGYAGIAWAIVGKHDRPWFDRAIFGLVRPMSGASLARKFDARAYIHQNSGEKSLLDISS